MQTKSALGLTRVGTETVGVLRYLLVGGLVLGCTSGSEDRSGDDPSQTAQPPPPAAVAPDSSVAPPPQQDVVPETAGQQADRPDPAVAQPQQDAPPPAPPPAAEQQADRPDPVVAPPPTLAEVLTQHMDSLTSIRGVVGVDSAACNGAPCIQITVARRTQKILAELPVSLEGYPVTVVERGGGH